MRREWLWLIGVLAVVTLAALPVLTYPLGRDQGEFATIGRGILNGRVPYVDLWNPKPPAVFYVYALAMRLFGQTSEALRLIDLLIVPPIAASLYWLGRRLGGWRVGLWAAFLFGVFYFSETFWTLTQNDGIVLLPMALAMVCAFKAADGGRGAAAWALIAGGLCAWALWFKYPFVLFTAAVVIAYLLWRRAEPVQSLQPKVIAALFAGVLLVGGGGVLALASMGALEALIESARVTSEYTALGFNAADFGAALETALGFRWSHWGLLFVLAAVWWIASRLPAAESAANPRAWAAVWVWALAGLLIMLVQAKAYDYHWLPMLPPLALLGADSLERLMRGVARGGHAADGLRLLLGAGLVVALAAGVWGKALPYLSGQETQSEYYARFQAGEFVADESLAVASYLRERVAPGDSLTIWGFRPEVYYLSRLNPATRFIFQFPLVGTWYPPEWKEEHVDVLWAAMPPYALVVQVDYMPWVTGRDADSNTLLQEYTELNNWLIANYTLETQIGNFFVWRRTS